MLRKMLSCFALPLLLLLSNSSGNSAPHSPTNNSDGPSGTLQKMMVESGRVTIDLDLSRLEGSGSAKQDSKRESVRFEVSPNSFFTILVFEGVLRSLEPGSMALLGGNSTVLPASLGASANQLMIESTAGGEAKPRWCRVEDGYGAHGRSSCTTRVCRRRLGGTSRSLYHSSRMLK